MKEIYMYENVINLFYQNRNPERAIAMAAYMKNNFPFLGIPKPERSALGQGFIHLAKKGPSIDWDFVFRLWELPEREFQYIAVDYLLALKSLLQKDDLAKLEVLTTRKSWWDTVDSLATITGVLCARYPELIADHIVRWAEAENIWLVRISILFQLKYKEKTDPELLSHIICRNSSTKEFFINKAIGWALREYSKTNSEWVKTFIESVPLHPLSVREGGKYIFGQK
ncbi:MAG: DNA alkylation repair protein [Negativicutes bacterium]|nr:DNA alkylation repair protein [Negativicutes bacterium]